MATSAWWLPQCELRVHAISWDVRHALLRRHGLHLCWNWCVKRINEFGERNATKLTNCATWYTSSPAGERPNRFTQDLRTVAASLRLSWTINTPVTSNCTQLERTNLFGRVLNGVPVGQECEQSTTTELTSGSFLSVVQKRVAREDAQWDEAVWARAIRETWAGSCSSGYKLDGDNVACMEGPAVSDAVRRGWRGLAWIAIVGSCWELW